MQCSRCGKEITDVAYIEINPAIVNTSKGVPIVFESIEKRNIYSLRPIMHDSCFVDWVTSMGMVVRKGIKK